MDRADVVLWKFRFATELARIFPGTPAVVTEQVAHARHAHDAGLEAAEAARRWALTHGAPTLADWVRPR